MLSSAMGTYLPPSSGRQPRTIAIAYNILEGSWITLTNNTREGFSCLVLRFLSDGLLLPLESPEPGMQSSPYWLTARSPATWESLLLHTQAHSCSGLALASGKHRSLPCSLCHLDSLKWRLRFDSRLGVLHISCHQSQSHCHLFLSHCRHIHGSVHCPHS